MIRAEYLRFLQTLNATAVPTDVRKFANLVLANMDELVPMGTHQGQRIKRIVALAQINWDTINAVIQPLPEQAEEHSSPIPQLKSMAVGPFRSFERQEVFDLESRLVLIYGPNGTGKSSFCEALEYGLLGNVAEAENRRFRDQHEYLKNAHVNRFTAPAIVGLNEQEEEVSIEANEALYRFCFVEKNRIDVFSRIAAQAPAKQTELISTLFGLDSFNEFVRNFTTDIDARYIDLTGEKAASLEKKRQALAGSQQQIITTNAELQTLSTEEQTLANQYRKSSTFNQVVVELNGDQQKTGAIQQLDAELRKPQANKSNLTVEALVTLGGSISTGIIALKTKQQELADAHKQMSFKNLYDAVIQLQTITSEHCPACKTPLNQVTRNPFTHAKEELQKLQHLVGLQQAEQQQHQQIALDLQNLSQTVNTCLGHLPTDNALQNSKLPPNTLANIEWWNLFSKPLQDGFTPWQHIHVQVTQLEQTDKAIDPAAKVLATKQATLSQLRRVGEQIIALQARRNAAQRAIEIAQQTIDNFNTENAQLISDVDEERTVVVKNNAIKVSYSVFITRLNNYKERLPGQLVANLGEMVVILYNAFNRNDSQGELLAEVKLPLVQNQRLEISFQNNSHQFYDALHVLSEGHIRCIGLAILLAKNLKERCPLLIFDDPVNAIDDDHRESIRRTLFEDQHFSNKKIILTCHGEEFFKDIQNLLPAQAAAQARTFSFLPRLDEPHIQVDFNCAPRNYIIAARGHFDRNEIREALSMTRKGLESLTKGKVWNYVRRHGDGNLSLKFRSPAAQIELRNLTEQLKTKIGKDDFSDPDKQLVYTPINALLGLNGDSREWRYLNKGTHEENDRAEFQREIVSTMISQLESLDRAL